MRVVPLLSVVLAAAAVAAGCSAERPEQQAARSVVERHVLSLGEYDHDDVHCTRNPRPWFVEQPTNVYLCAVGRGDGDCDWFRVTVRDGEPTVTLDTPRAGCVLPA